MSYTIDKQTGHLVISGFDKGIAPDPYTGISDMRQVNINTVPGEVSVGFSLTNTTVTSGSLGIPVHKAIQLSNGVATIYYICDAGGNVFKSNSGNVSATWATTSAPTTGATISNQGMAYLQRGDGYLFRFRNDSIDYYNGSSWVTGWNPTTGGSGATGTILANVNHFAFTDPNSVLYFCNGSGIGSIMEKAGQKFDPTNPATYTVAITVAPANVPANDLNALKLPTYDVAQSITYLGTTLLIGGSLNAIYPWDRVSTSFNFPIFIADTFIGKMVSANTNVFIFPGNTTGRGRIFITNGSQAEEWVKFPDALSGYQEPYYRFYDAIYHRNSVVFGAEVKQNGSGAIITGVTAEIWAIDCTTKAFRGISDIIGGSASARLLIPGIGGNLEGGYQYIAAVSDGSTNAISYSNIAAGTGTGFVISDKIPIGTFLSPKTFAQVEFKLATPLQSGESIQLSYIDQLTSAVIANYTFAGGITMASNTGVNFEKSQWIQLRADLVGNSATSGCRLKELRLIP